MNEHLILSVGVVMVFFTLGLKLNRDPGPMDSFIAYRTASSKRNEDTWYESNTYAGRLMMIFASLKLLAVFVIVGYSGILMLLKVIPVLVVVSTTLVFILTERRMRYLFFRDGKRKPTTF
jgi:hypothetical protein